MARPRRTAEFGRLYNGREGQWSWLVHRVTGVAVILFLFAHVVDTAVVGWGPEAYNRVMEAYHNPLVRALELGLVACVLYHAINGTKILLYDFWPRAALHHRTIARITLGVFVAVMIPVALIMGGGILESF